MEGPRNGCVSCRAAAVVDRPLGTAFANEQYADTFQQVRRLVHALGQKNVGERVALVDLDPPGNQDRRSVRGNRLDLLNQLRTVEAAGHDEVTEDQVHPAAAEGFERLRTTAAGDDAVATRFQQDFANGKILFVVVDAEDRFLGFHDLTGRPPFTKNSLFMFSENAERTAC